MEIKKYFLQPGYIFITKEPYIIETVLGSCVALCLWDKINKIGAMNHYIYPECNDIKKQTAKYGNVSLNHMIKMYIKDGGILDNTIAYAFGGAKNIYLSSLVGDSNVEIVNRVLGKYQIKLSAYDFGGIRGRKVTFNTENGEYKIDVIKSNNLGVIANDK
ncbi:MAG: chemotaxis protein CheD [Fusobacteria bacterium]|nr:chemotaxis protein CheD [Fusobacteriota bacterium]